MDIEIRSPLYGLMVKQQKTMELLSGLLVRLTIDYTNDNCIRFCVSYSTSLLMFRAFC